jgi:hypothetical protein
MVVSAYETNNALSLPLRVVERLAVIFGDVLLLMGIVAFVPGLAPDHYLFGVMQVNVLQSSMHILIGIIAIAAGLWGERTAHLFFKVMGLTTGALVLLLAVLVKLDIAPWLVGSFNQVTLLVYSAASLVGAGFGFSPEVLSAGSALPTGRQATSPDNASIDN